ncbi:MAG: DNA gyrase subunit A [Planctomycetota bacterium]
MEHDSRIQNLNIEEEMKGSYLTYAMSVIISRALPDVRDGLKPSQRRILVAMNDLNLGARAKHRKCAKIAGDTSGNYHPHGESVVYPTLVRLAQPFNMRYRLIDGQGNFGSIDGDPPAAMRYTEARLTAPSVEMLDDLDKNTVDFVRNYDDVRDEPTVLPAKFPNLLVNGGSGIAVGMATNFAPHSLREVCDALLATLVNPNISLFELMKHIPGPDFPTGGLICGRKGIISAYKSGRGIITLRAKVEHEEQGNRQLLVATEIPYQVSKSKLASDIADGVKEGRLTGISDIRDESDRTGIRLVIEVKRGDSSEIVLNQLYKHTQLQTSFGIQCVALVDGRPRTLDLRSLLLAYRDHRFQVIRRRSRHLLELAERRAHILRGYLIALDQIDRVIALIRASHTVDDARAGLVREFGLTTLQADHILRLTLQRLTGLERLKIEEELKDVQTEIAYHREVLTSDAKVTEIIRADIEEMREKYGDDRRSEILDIEEEIDMEDLIADEAVVVTMSHQGYIKRTPLSTYRSQGRGGLGITAGSTRDGDFIMSLYVASTHDYVLFFTSHGKVFWLKVYDIPDLPRTSKGRAIINLLQLGEGERVLSSLQVREFDDRMVLLATRNGVIKKTVLTAFSRPKKNGIIAIGIDDGDGLIGAALTSGEDDVVLASESGMSIRFNETDVRATGRGSRGVKGMELDEGDHLVSMVVAPKGSSGSLLTVAENGFGKRTALEEYRIQRRGGKGVIDIRTTERNGRVVASRLVNAGDHVMLMTSGGMLVRIEADSFRDIGRNTQGVRLIRVKDDDRVIGAELVHSEEVKKDEEAQAAEAAAKRAAAASAVAQSGAVSEVTSPDEEDAAEHATDEFDSAGDDAQDGDEDE